MRAIDLNQKSRQDALGQNPVFKVLRKASEWDLDENYVDITSIVSKVELNINGEGEPNTAHLEVASTKGAFDIFNIKSAYRLYFRKGTKVQIYAGYQTADVLMFTGYVIDFFDHSYEKGKAESVSIKLGDRGYGDGKIDYHRDKITTREYYKKDDESMWTIKELIEDVLVQYGNMLIEEIFIDNELDECLLGNIEDIEHPLYGSVQFIEETIWDIVQLCCEVRRHIGYFDENGYFRTKKMQFTILDLTEGTDLSGTFNKEISHFIDDSDIQAQMTVIGGVKYAGRRAEKTIVIDVDPWQGAFGIKIDQSGEGNDFETWTNGTGNSTDYDSLYGIWDAPDDEKFYGAGFQGTCVPYDGSGIKEPPYEEPAGPPDRSDYNTWRLCVFGPFKYTLGGVPNEPYQITKTGLGDGADMGSTGFFTKYNSDNGTIVEVNPNTLGPDSDTLGGDGFDRQWPHAIKQMVGTHYQFKEYYDSQFDPYQIIGLPGPPRALMPIMYGVLMSRKDWLIFWENEFQKDAYPPDFPYPDAVVGDYDGPTETEFFIFMASHMDYFKYYWAVKFEYYRTRELWLSMEAWFHRVWRWGITYAADWTELPTEHFTGTYQDHELMDYYGTNRYDELENPLIFTDAECELLGSITIDRLRKFHCQARFTRAMNLELEIGDLIKVFNKRTQCYETISITRLEYRFKKSNPGFSVDFDGGVITVEDQEIKAWSTE